MLKKLLNKKQALLQEMETLLKAAEDEDRNFTPEEKASFDELKVSLEDVKEQIEAAKVFATESTLVGSEEKEKEVETSKPQATKTSIGSSPVSAGVLAEPAKKKFESLAEFTITTIMNPNDQRLEYQEIQGASDMEFKTGSRGGFMVPKEFLDDFKSMPTSPAFMRPGAQVIPAGDHPDAEIEIPALDQRETSGSTNQVHGGVEIVHTEEGGTMTQTDAALRMVSYKPKEISGYVRLTNKMLRNWRASQRFITQLLVNAKVSAEEIDFMVGNGVGKAKGFIDADATLAINRAGSNAIALADLKAMYAAYHGQESDAVWAVSGSAFAELLDIVGDGGGATNIVPPNQSGQGMLVYGIPVVKPGRGVRTLGSKGDISLIDRSKYIIKDGSGPMIAASEHVNWTSNKTLVKIVFNVDGGPWLTEPFRDEEDRQVSPFVTLDVPA